MRAVDAAQALAELTAISSQVEVAVIADGDHVVAATYGGGDELAAAGRALLDRAAELRGGEPARLDVSTEQGDVFVVRHGARTIVATTTREPTVGLVFYDLKNCLRNAS